MCPATRSRQHTKEPPWTASRRHRLLRTLQTRINAVRNLVGSTGILQSQSAGLVAPATTKARRGSSSIHEENPDYLTTKKRCRRGQVTYVSKSRTFAKSPPVIIQTPRKSTSSSTDLSTTTNKLSFRPPTTPGRIHLETPLVHKIRQYDTPRRPSAEFDPKTPSGRFTSCQNSLASLKPSINMELYKEYDFVLHALKNILGQTQPPQNTNKSPLSLLSLCLQKTTHVISALQAQQEEDREAEGKAFIRSSNTAADIYAHLETMNPSGQGWEPLRVLILREATEILCKAIGEGLFTTSFTQLVLQAFAEHELFDEAALLIKTATDLQYDPPSDGNDTTLLPPTLILLYDFCKHHKRRDLLFIILENLLYTGRLPGEWLGTQAFMSIWGEALKALAGSGSCRPVMDFAGMALAILSHASGCKDEDSSAQVRMCERTFVSVLGAITALALISRKKNDKGNLVAGSVTRRIVFLLTHCVLYARAKFRRTRSRDSISLVALACYLSSQGSSDLTCQSWDDALNLTSSDISKSLGPIDTAIHRMAIVLICSIAQGCSRGSSIPPHHHLLRLREFVAGVDLVGLSLQDSMTECAILLAQRTGDLRDVVYAETLTSAPKKSKSSVTCLQPPVAKGTYMGYVWDDALAEWVNAAPVKKVSQNLSVPLVPLRFKRSASLISDGSSSSRRRSASVRTAVLLSESGSEHEESRLVEDSGSDDDSESEINEIPAKIPRFETIPSIQDPEPSDSDDLASTSTLSLVRSAMTNRTTVPIKRGRVVKAPIPKVGRSTTSIDFVGASQPIAVKRAAINRRSGVTLTTMGTWSDGSSDDDLI